MAKSLTSSFTLTSQSTWSPGGAATTTTIPIGSLIDVADAQALEVESVDWILQSYDTANEVYGPILDGLPAAGAWGVAGQLTDKNQGGLIGADDGNLIASMNFAADAAGVGTRDADMYPDDFTGGDGRYVVNDELYFCVDGSGIFAGNYIGRLTVRIRAKVVKLSTRDWMAISLETVQNE